MSTTYKPLTVSHLGVGVTYRRPAQDTPENVDFDSPATAVMTDLTKVAAVTMGPCVSLDAARDRMIASGVRLLLVTDQANRILGIITTVDLENRPMQYLKEHGGRREDIYIRDIMTPQEKLEVLDMAEVARASVGDVIETLKSTGRKHALVVERDEQGNEVLRGLFAASRMGQLLGVSIETTERVTTFADLGQLKSVM